jgi:outer membrane receptor protein involved in Fe transport
LPYLAPWSGSFNLKYAFAARHTAGFSLIYNSQRDDTNDFRNDDPDAFVLVNLFGYGRINKQWSYALGVDNLLDKRIYDAAADFGSQHNTEKSEREIWARLEWKLGL